MIADQAIRKQALDVRRSFLVQAPAGSGKTGLLVQRYLALLAHAEQGPEECLAITFTRKAAMEMRERVIDALKQARDEDCPSDPHPQQNWELARRALQRDEAMEWHLIENPSRLKIQTFDALCAACTRQMPMISRFGMQPNILEEPEVLYTLAVDRLLHTGASLPELETPLRVLLRHLDNNKLELRRMLIDLLPMREQWLPYVVQAGKAQSSNEVRHYLQEGLRAVIQHHLQAVVAHIPPGLDEIPRLADHAAATLRSLGDESEIRHCEGLRDWPSSSLETLPQWVGLSELLLTQTGQWRKTVTQKQGFSAPSHAPNKSEKEKLKNLKQRMLDQLTAVETETLFREALSLLPHLPTCEYQEHEWKVLQALATLLPLLAAQLNVVFQEMGAVDFPEVAMAAQLALGSSESPTDLALALDYKIRHLLVDEFQDTSLSQFELLKKLTAGWQADDGRTLFLVGDPMQSIYRFRQAEVGLFLTVQQQGLGDIALEFLRLSVNFRSQPGIIQWINQTFESIFPKEANPTVGAIPYTPSVARPAVEGGAAKLWVSNEADPLEEAKILMDHIRAFQQKDPHATTAILVRSRAHLQSILPALKQAGLGYQGVSIEPLQSRSVIVDLLALFRAVNHFADRTAWLSILRAPWCGIRLNDLLILTKAAEDGSLWPHLKNLPESLSADAKLRIQRLQGILQTALDQRGEEPFAEWFRKTWSKLGGIDCYEDLRASQDAEAFFKFLQQLQSDPQLFEVGYLEDRLKNLYALPDQAAPSQLQIMTIHKSKGLEFDQVIVPGLGFRGMNDVHQLLQWQLWTDPSDTPHLLMAPIQSIPEQEEKTYQFLRHLERQKQHQESLRLLYVAATRAKQDLLLLGHEVNGKAVRNSLLESMGSKAVSDFASEFVEGQEQMREETIDASFPSESTKVVSFEEGLPLRRFTTSWVDRSLQEQANEAPLERASVMSSLALDRLFYQSVGIVVHRMFYWIVQQGLSKEQALEKIPSQRDRWIQQVQMAGVSGDYLEEAQPLVEQAVRATLMDAKGHWILTTRGEGSHAEWKLSCFKEGLQKNFVIDRCFFDQGVRWIVDYKTCITTETMEVFEDSKPQLYQYAQLVKEIYPKQPIRKAFYFPLQQEWKEVIP